MKAMPLPCPPRQRPLVSRTLQRGAIAILAAVGLPIAILATVLVIDTGRLFLERRDLQKIADTAALEAISRLPSGNCAAHESLAIQNANDNAAAYGFGSAAGETVTTVCVGLTTNATTGVRAPDNTIAADQRRAVQVTTSRVVPASLILRAGSLFGVGGDNLTLSAQAVAEKDQLEPWAEFSVGAQLLSLNNSGLLGTVLSGVGVTTDLTVLSSAGLASAKVTPAGLLRALGINLSIDELKALSPAGLVQLVNTEVGALGVDDLINLGAKVVGDSTLQADLGALRDAVATNAVLGPATVQLFGTASTPGLLRLNTGAENHPLGAALDAQINLGDLLSGGIMAGAAGRGLVIPNASLLGLATLSLGIVEPPTIAVGPVGTQAYNAQLRLHVNVDTDSAPLAGPLLDTLGVSIHLPITVDLADARGTLTDIDCSVIPTTATVQVDSSVGNVCLGEIPEGALWSDSSSCTALVQDTDLVTALGGTLLSGKIALPALTTADTTTPLPIGESYKTVPNTLNIGQLLTDLGTQLTGLLSSSQPGGAAAEPFTLEQATAMADRILGLPELQPATPGLYRSWELDAVKNKLDELGLNWDRPAVLLLTTKMHIEWRTNAAKPACYVISGHYTLECIRTELIASLQTTADAGLLGKVINGVLTPLLSQIGGPLLAMVLNGLMTVLQPLLDTVGTALSALLSGLGIDLTRTDVQMRDISCGMPRLVN